MTSALRCELLLALGEARVRAGERPLAWGRSARRRRSRPSSATARSLARAAIGASRRYIQPPGVVDEELIALLEQALELTAGERPVVRVALLTRLCGALYYSRPRRADARSWPTRRRAWPTRSATPEARALAAAARRRAYWDPAHLEQRLADSTELLTLAREARRPRAGAPGPRLAGRRPARAAASRRPSTPRSRPSPPGPSGCASRSTCGTPPSGGRCGRCSTAGSRRPSDWRARRWRSAPPAETRHRARSTTRSSCWPSAASRAGWPSSRRAGARAGRRQPPPAAWRAALADAAVRDRAAGRGARRSSSALARARLRGHPARRRLADRGRRCWPTRAPASATARAAALLYELLLPYAAVNVVIGLAAVCLGSAARLPGPAGRHGRRARSRGRALRAGARGRTRR